MKKDRIVIGIGGNIGSGKTTAAKIFKSFGMRYISADSIGKRILPEIKDKLKSHFGNRIFSGSKIDRRKLRDIAFSNQKNLKTLNRLSHPLLLNKIYGKLDKIHSGMVVIDAALLFYWPELLKIIDYPILIKASTGKKRERAQRRGISKDMFYKILRFQQTESEMEKKARFIIKNNGTFTHLRKQCQKIFKEMKNDR